jgi:hypothetical protein
MIVDQAIHALWHFPSPGYFLEFLGFVAFIALVCTVVRIGTELALIHAVFYFIAAASLLGIGVQMITLDRHTYNGAAHGNGWGIIGLDIFLTLLFVVMTILTLFDGRFFARVLFTVGSWCMVAGLCWEIKMREHTHSWAGAYAMFEILAAISVAVCVARGVMLYHAKRRSVRLAARGSNAH